jgi:iron complex transport system ATP-binding protein
VTGIAVEARRLCFSRPGNANVLRDVELGIEPGEIVCVLGPNGAGKSTLLRCLAGLVRPTSGSVRIGGRDVRTMSAKYRARLVAYVPQATTSVFPFTALDMVVMGRTPHLSPGRVPSRSDRWLARETLCSLGLEHLRDQPFDTLSGGERSLTLVARALVQEAEVLLLDEPTASLDLGNTVRVLTTIRSLAAEKRTVIMATHQPDHALLIADRSVVMARGEAIDDGDPGLTLTPAALSAVYETPVEILYAELPGATRPISTVVSSALARDAAPA